MICAYRARALCGRLSVLKIFAFFFFFWNSPPLLPFFFFLLCRKGAGHEALLATLTNFHSHISVFRRNFLFLWPIVSRPREECIFFWPSNQSVRRHKTSLFRLFTVRRFQKLQRSATRKKAEKNSRALKNTNGEKEEAFTRDFIFIIS